MAGLPTSTFGVVLLTGLVGAGLLAVGFALREVGAIRQVVGGPSTDIYSLSTGISGPISISGTAQRYDDEIVSPFTGTVSLALAYEIQERRSTNNGTEWVETDSGRAAVPFLLEDETGSVLVDPSRARLGLDSSERIEVDGGERPPPRVYRFIDQRADVDAEDQTWDLKIIELNVGADRRYVERRLDPGEAVTVFGEAAYEPGISSRVGQVNVVLSAGSHPLILSETTPYRTVARVFWPVLVAACLGIGLLGAAAALVFL